MDVEWAKGELRLFISLTEMVGYPQTRGMTIIGSRPRGSEADIAGAAQVVEQILDRVLAGWRRQAGEQGKRSSNNEWASLRQFAARGLTQLEQQDELRSKLGDNAPTLDAGQMHPWVWDAARSLWQSEHYAEAVQAAAVRINAETQSKVGRRDIGEVALFQQVFSPDDAAPGKPRLRVPPNDGTPSSVSRQRGARALGEALFSGLRNPLAHQGDELTEHDALEQLAAFSLLARWVDASALAVSE